MIAWNDLGIKNPYPLSYVEMAQDWLVALSITPHSLLLSLSRPSICSLKPFLYSLCPGRYILLHIWFGNRVDPMNRNYSFSPKCCKVWCLAYTTMHRSVIGQTSRLDTQVPFILHLTAHSPQNTHYGSMPSFHNIRCRVIRGCSGMQNL